MHLLLPPSPIPPPHHPPPPCRGIPSTSCSPATGLHASSTSSPVWNSSNTAAGRGAVTSASMGSPWVLREWECVGGGRGRGRQLDGARLLLPLRRAVHGVSGNGEVEGGREMISIYHSADSTAEPPLLPLICYTSTHMLHIHRSFLLTAAATSTPSTLRSSHSSASGTLTFTAPGRQQQGSDEHGAVEVHIPHSEGLISFIATRCMSRHTAL